MPMTVLIDTFMKETRNAAISPPRNPKGLFVAKRYAFPADSSRIITSDNPMMFAKLAACLAGLL